MSKVIAVSAMGAGGTGVALTGAYAMGLFGGVDYEIPETFDKFKESNVGGCIKEVFSILEDGKLSDKLPKDSGNVISSSSDVTLDTTTGAEEKGCLVVNWDKWKSNDGTKTDKWRGNFRFLWSFAKGNKGFVVYTSANTAIKSGASEGELLVEGGAYTLTKDTTNKKWSFSKKLEVPATTSGTKKSLGKESLSDSDIKFPKQGTALKGFDSNSFWNFLKSSDLNSSTNLCETTGCDKKDSSFRGYWTWKPDVDAGDDKKLGSWSSDVDKWWKAIYDSDNSKWNMKDLIKDIKGEWIESHFSGILKSVAK